MDDGGREQSRVPLRYCSPSSPPAGRRRRHGRRLSLSILLSSRFFVGHGEAVIIPRICRPHIAPLPGAPPLYDVNASMLSWRTGRRKECL